MVDLCNSPWAVFSEVAERHGLRTTVVSDDAIAYSRGKTYFQLTSNERDGTDLTFGRMQNADKPGFDESESISLNVVVGTVETVRKKQGAKSLDREFKALTLLQAFDRWLPVLLLADDDLFNRLSRLRFWHTGDWPECWGQTITMTAAEVKQNKDLIASVAAAFPNDA